MKIPLCLAIVVGLCATAYCNEVLAPNLKLRSTYLKTTDAGLTITPTPVDAVSPTTVSCPGGCVLGIQLSSQFSGLTPGEVVAAIVMVDGSTAAVLPNAVLGLDSTSVGGGSDARTFLWATRSLSTGSHSVAVQLSVTAGLAGSANRTLKIDVYQEKDDSQ